MPIQIYTLCSGGQLNMYFACNKLLFVFFGERKRQCQSAYLRAACVFSYTYLSDFQASLVLRARGSADWKGRAEFCCARAPLAAVFIGLPMRFSGPNKAAALSRRSGSAGQTTTTSSRNVPSTQESRKLATEFWKPSSSRAGYPFARSCQPVAAELWRQNMRGHQNCSGRWQEV